MISKKLNQIRRQRRRHQLQLTIKTGREIFAICQDIEDQCKKIRQTIDNYKHPQTKYFSQEEMYSFMDVLNKLSLEIIELNINILPVGIQKCLQNLSQLAPSLKHFYKLSENQIDVDSKFNVLFSKREQFYQSLTSHLEILTQDKKLFEIFSEEGIELILLKMRKIEPTVKWGVEEDNFMVAISNLLLMPEIDIQCWQLLTELNFQLFVYRIWLKVINSEKMQFNCIKVLSDTYRIYLDNSEKLEQYSSQNGWEKKIKEIIIKYLVQFSESFIEQDVVISLLKLLNHLHISVSEILILLRSKRLTSNKQMICLLNYFTYQSDQLSLQFFSDSEILDFLSTLENKEKRSFMMASLCNLILNCKYYSIQKKRLMNIIRRQGFDSLMLEIQEENTCAKFFELIYKKTQNQELDFV